MSVKKKRKLHEGRTKTLYETEAQDQYILTFENAVPGADGALENKGAVNSRVCALLFRYLESYNIATHFISEAGADSIVIRQLGMIPLSVSVHNQARASLARRTEVKTGEELQAPLIEFFAKEDTKQSTPLNKGELLQAGAVNEDELDIIERVAVKSNAVLKSFFERRGLSLAAFKLEFGRHKGRVVIGDELSLDTCFLWDAESGEKYEYQTNRDLAAAQEQFHKISQRLL